MADNTSKSANGRLAEEVQTDKTVELPNRDSMRKRRSEFGKRSSRVGIDGIGGLKVEKQEKAKKRPMLTSSQLSDLFTRLDKDGSGELDLDEFTGIIKMMKIKVTPDYIAKVFRSVDSTGSSDAAGTLDLQEFIAAYQKIYTGVAVDGMDATSAFQRKSFVRATRYGYTSDRNYVFECYTIPSDGVPQVYSISDLPNEDDAINVSPTSALDPLTILSLTKGEPWTVDGEVGTVDHVYKMMRQDGMKNKRSSSALMWWVDVSYSMVDWTTAEELVSKFGLPNDSKFLASYGNFNNGLPADPKSRMFAGTGNHIVGGSVHSLSHFAQSLYIEQVPVVHHLPPWVKSWQCTAACTSPTLSKILDGAVRYYTTRFAWMANLSGLSKTASDEKISAYERAEDLSTLLKSCDTGSYGGGNGDGSGSDDDDGGEDDDNEDDDDDDDDDDDFSVLLDATQFAKSTIFSSRGRGAPLPARVGYNSPPTWLRSNSQIFAKPPRMKIDSISMHVLDQGFGANCLLTVRQMDPEMQQKKRFLSHSHNYSVEQQSRMGILGRIISGVWTKLAEVTMCGRGTEIAGELTESPASLATFLQMLIHTFSMNSCAPLDYWLKVLEKEIKDIVVSKHSLHLSEVERILKEFSSYLDPLEALVQSMSQQQEEFSQDILSHKISEFSPQHRMSTVEISAAASRRRSIAVAMETKMFDALPPEVEKIPLSFAIIHSFFGTNPYREIRAVLDGYRLLDIKGLVYWKERLKKYATKVDSLKQLIALQLDEKRNFMSFMLTVITTLLAPLAILTGYFGMNFDNMTELDSTSYPNAPGVKLMWVICVGSYTVLFLYALHSRVLYSAT